MNVACCGTPAGPFEVDPQRDEQLASLCKALAQVESRQVVYEESARVLVGGDVKELG